MSKTPTIADNMPRGDDWVAQKFASLDREIQELKAARTLEAAAIGKGGLTIEGGFLKVTEDGSIQVVDPSTGRTVLYAGTALTVDGDRQMIFTLLRDDGTVALALGDFGTAPGHPHQQSMQIPDRSGNAVFADDTVSGKGIATPYIPSGQFVDLAVPSASTSSGSFAALQWAHMIQQHPQVRALVLAYTPSGTAGQIRLTVNGHQIGSTVSVPSNSFTIFGVPASPWPSGDYDWQQEVVVQLEGKVTSGGGALAAQGMALWGVQS